ncbi:YaiI/YqxD family protein [Listeria valentina]|uniref:YaiI/YqxD family protein n=1 Tax=Listeria valentina TaxID=2705293 RepID=UPI001430E733|nr:YaiI/YqxD family protein [Listeria valentina]
MPKIIVDADACPVKEEIKSLAQIFHLEVTYVASYNHFGANREDENWIYVDTEKEAADLRIVNLSKKGDIIITQDIGLASMLLSKCTVFSNRGEIYQDDMMPLMLEQRESRAKARRRGEYGKGPKAMTDQDRQTFKQNLEQFLTKLKFLGVDDK